MLKAIPALPGHVFWPDSISMVDPAHLDCMRVARHGSVTGSYLLALAAAHAAAWPPWTASWPPMPSRAAPRPWC
jgi:hypothetical protein